jgi:hypothetical protein
MTLLHHLWVLALGSILGPAATPGGGRGVLDAADIAAFEEGSRLVAAAIRE